MAGKNTPQILLKSFKYILYEGDGRISMYGLLWCFLLLVYVAVQLTVSLSGDYLLDIWALNFRYIFMPATIVWQFIMLKFHRPSFSFWTSQRLRKGEKNPQGVLGFFLYLIGAMFFALATVGLTSGIYVLYLLIADYAKNNW